MSNIPLFHSKELFSDPFRLLVKESHAIFSNIIRNDADQNASNVIAISRRYRSILHECVDNLTSDVANDHTEHIKTFKCLEVIWHLCEILLLDVSQTGILVMQLKSWIKMHFDDLSNEEKQISRSLDAGKYQLTEDSAEDDYWNLLTKLVLGGDTKRAVQLLSCHYNFSRNNQMQLVVSMLDTMPLSNQFIVHEFCNRWSNWSNWCKQERDTDQFSSNKHLLNIVRILSQDLSVYDELASKCDTWYQLMVSYLLYTDPCIRETDLSDLCRKMISTFRSNHPRYINKKSSEFEPMDEIVISVFEYEFTSIIVNCCANLDDNWWFVTHFVDLLHCCDQLKAHNINEPDKLRETFLRDYAATLFDDELLWAIGISYLDNCKISGIHFLEIILSRIPVGINDEAKANRIIAIARKRGLTGIPKSVCLLMARSWLSLTPRLGDEILRHDKQHRKSIDRNLPSPVNLSNALYWAVRSGDTSIITHISDQCLYYYCKTGTFPNSSIFESLRRLPLDNERLAFLTKYFEFRQLLLDPSEDLMTAGDLFKALLASKIYPKFFCQELISDAKKLLEITPQLIFQPDNTLDLMRSLEEITKNKEGNDDVNLRKNLVRNMARALITPIGSEK